MNEYHSSQISQSFSSHMLESATGGLRRLSSSISIRRNRSSSLNMNRHMSQPVIKRVDSFNSLVIDSVEVGARAWRLILFFICLDPGLGSLLG